VGPITYIISPELKFSRGRAEEAVAFADSVSAAFNVPRLRPTRYYMVRDGDAMMRVQGYEGDTIYGTPGGRSLGDAIISGDSVFRENHGHEIVHALILPLLGRNLGVIASEGVPTWLGGTRTMRYPEALRALRAHLIANPAATVDSLIESNLHEMHNPAAALLASMSFERAGVDGIRHFLNSGPSTEDFRKGLEELFAKPWPDIAAEWKRRALVGSCPRRYPVPRTPRISRDSGSGAPISCTPINGDTGGAISSRLSALASSAAAEHISAGSRSRPVHAFS
jgi:hypothetical protein